MRCGRPAPASSTPSRPRPAPCAPPRPEATPSPSSHFPVGKPFLRTARIVCRTEEKAQPCPWGLRAWGQVTNSSDHEFPRPGGGDGYCLATAQDGHRVKLDPGYGSPQSTVKCSVPRRSVPLVLLGSPGPAALHRASRALAFCGEGCQGPRGQLATVPGARQLAGAGARSLGGGRNKADGSWAGWWHRPVWAVDTDFCVPPPPLHARGHRGRPLESAQPPFFQGALLRHCPTPPPAAGVGPLVPLAPVLPSPCRPALVEEAISSSAATTRRWLCEGRNGVCFFPLVSLPTHSRP